MPGVRVLTLLDGQAGPRATCSHRHSMDIIIVLGVALIIDDAVSVIVQPEPFTHMWLMWSKHRVGLRCSHDFLLHGGREAVGEPVAWRSW